MIDFSLIQKYNISPQELVYLMAVKKYGSEFTSGKYGKLLGVTKETITNWNKRLKLFGYIQVWPNGERKVIGKIADEI